MPPPSGGSGGCVVGPNRTASEKPVCAPRPSADNGAAGAPATSPLPGTARSREALGHGWHVISVRPGACPPIHGSGNCLVAHGSKSANPLEAATAQGHGSKSANPKGAATAQAGVEMTNREGIYNTAIGEVEAHNAKLAASRETYHQSVNQLTDLTLEELQALSIHGLTPALACSDLTHLGAHVHQSERLNGSINLVATTAHTTA